MSDFQNLGRQLGTYSVYVSNLHIDTKKEDLLELFKDCGKVSTTFVASITERPYNNIYGFVRFFKHEDTLNAVEEMHNWSYRGMKITVELSTETRERMRAKGLIPNHGYCRSSRSSGAVTDSQRGVTSLTMNNLMHESRLHDICAEINKQEVESGSDHRLDAEKILSNVSRLQCKKMLPLDGSLVGETKGNLTYISKNMFQREQDGDIPRNSTKTFLAILKEVLESVHGMQPEADLKVKAASPTKLTNTIDSIVSVLFDALEKITTNIDFEKAPHREVVHGHNDGHRSDGVTDCKVKSDGVTGYYDKNDGHRSDGVTDCKVRIDGFTDCKVKSDGDTNCENQQPILDSGDMSIESLHISKTDNFVEENTSIKCFLQNNYKAVGMDVMSLKSTERMTSAVHKDQDVKNYHCITDGVASSFKTSVMNDCLCNHCHYQVSEHEVMTSSEDDEDRYRKFCELTGQSVIADNTCECPLENRESILNDGSVHRDYVRCNFHRSRKSTDTSVSDSSQSSDNDSLFVDLVRIDSGNSTRNLSEEPVLTPTQTDFSGQLKSLLKCDAGLSEIKIVHNHTSRHFHHGSKSAVNLPLRRPCSIPQAALHSLNCVPRGSGSQSSDSSSLHKAIQGDDFSSCSMERRSRLGIPTGRLPSIGRGLSSILRKLRSMETRILDPVDLLNADSSVPTVSRSARGACKTSIVPGEQERRNHHSRTCGEVLDKSGSYSPSKSERRFRPLKPDCDIVPSSVNPTCAPLTRGRGRGQLSDRCMMKVGPPEECSGANEQNRGLIRDQAEPNRDKSPCGDVAADSGVESDSLNTNLPLAVVQRPVRVMDRAGDGPNEECSPFNRENPVKSYLKTLIGRGRGRYTEESNSKICAISLK